MPDALGGEVISNIPSYRDHWLSFLVGSFFQSITILAAILFFIGWTFGSQYYLYFGMGLSQLEIQVTSYLAWGVQVITESTEVKLYLFIIFVSIILFLAFFNHLAKQSATWLQASIVVSFFLLIVISYTFLLVLTPNVALELARDRAIKDSKLFTTSLSSIRIAIKSTEQNENILETKYNFTNGKYLYLGKHKSTYHVFKPVREVGVEIPRVFMIPSELVIVGELSRSSR